MAEIHFSVPEDFDYNPNTGHHGDRSHRMELKRSSIEYIAPSEYMVYVPDSKRELAHMLFNIVAASLHERGLNTDHSYLQHQGS